MRRRAIRNLRKQAGFSDLNAEKAQATKKALFEKLQVDVIELQHGPKADFLSQACDILCTGGNEVDSESKKVLRLSVAPDGAISFGCSVPGSKSETLITLLQEFQALEEVSVDRQELVD